MNMEERLQAVVSQAETDGTKWHTIIHGDNATTISTENGNVSSVAKQLKDVHDELINGVSDYLGQCQTAKNETVQIKAETLTIKTQTETLKSETLALRNETETYKDLAQTTFNSIASATTASVAQVQTEGQTQIALATAQANLAQTYALNASPMPLGTKLTIPACSKVPDGYEPVWYKNTITRARYPDFFTQLVDTNSLTLIDETTYDSQVATYGMCASYVKVDNDTLILPFLVNFGRGGTLSQLGGVELDQFQGHYHSAQVRVDTYDSGDGATLNYTNGTDEGLRAGSPDLFIYEPTTGANGTVRFGDETRPKSYYELTYIKCADVSRTLTMEETSQIRTLLTRKLNTDLSNFPSNIDYCIENYIDTNGNWYRVYKSGRLEQGGFFGGATSAWANVSITYLKPFQNTNHQLFCLGNWNDATSSSCRVYAKSTTGASITYANNTTGIQLSVWYAVGLSA
ncbi:MAG: hypothetical protein PHI50_00755 [Alphaproteobacteria bacterium]|nr:hypothetical protein [Alphaproteobacteria bacterium]